VCVPYVCVQGVQGESGFSACTVAFGIKLTQQILNIIAHVII